MWRFARPFWLIDGDGTFDFLPASPFVEWDQFRVTEEHSKVDLHLLLHMSLDSTYDLAAIPFASGGWNRNDAVETTKRDPPIPNLD